MTPQLYIRENELNYFEGRIVELVTDYIHYEDGSLLLEEAQELLALLIEQTKKEEDIEFQIPLWADEIISERFDLDE